MSERFGSWQLDALLAVGGVGEIWQASRSDQVAAVKRLHTHLVRNTDVRAQFAIEQRLATRLPRHPNLVHAFDAGHVDGRPYLAMALAPGDDLRRLLHPPPRPNEPPGPRSEPADALPRASVLAIVIAACDGAAHLHGNGFVHGDINPGNLMITAGDHVTLIDLGIARAIGGTGAVRGTHAYMAPEQVRGEPWTPATDVFALGVVLWELTASARLFHRGPPWLSMAAVVEAPAPPLADPGLDAIAHAALAKHPADRIASAAELAQRLRAER